MDLDLSIIVVNWNVCELLRRCLASIEANRGDLSLEVIVVDNASSDDSVPMVEQEFPQVHLIASRENLGYTGGNNLGLKEAGGRCLLILNPDTEIVGHALEHMVTYLDSHPAVGAVGPQLLNPDGSVQSSRRRFPQLLTAFFDSGTSFSMRWFPNNRFERAYFMADSPDDKVQSVDWLVGAALMIRRKAWQEVGPLDEQFFMYSEELDWCRRCREVGWEVHYLPTAQIVHYEQGSARQTGVTTWIRVYRSKILYFRKYFGPVWANVIRLFLLMDFARLLATEAAFWAIGRRDETRCRRMRDYWQVLESGLR
jgi:N-acetylglucosaminyl-diphospho-decaprenol L-rhamnosyltransferase